MRDNFNYDLVPMVHDSHMTTKQSPVNVSNGYYGYHAVPCRAGEGAVENGCEMEVQSLDEVFPPRPIQNHQQNGRKRTWDFFRGNDDTNEFKKRRQYDKIISNHKKKALPKVNDSIDELYEELLKETHGCSIYHWTSI